MVLVSFILLIFMATIITTNCFFVSHPYMERSAQVKRAFSITLAERAK